MWIIVTLIFILILLILWIILTYNDFIRLQALVEESYSGMDIYLKQRYDLIPNLVECVKGYTKHEESTLTKIVSLRKQISSCHNVSDKIQAQSQLSNALSNFLAVVEHYPDLKSNQQFLELQKKLTAIETDISQSRKYYNGTVKQYNNKVRMIPSNLIGLLFHFSTYPFYEIKDEERDPVKVEFY